MAYPFTTMIHPRHQWTTDPETVVARALTAAQAAQSESDRRKWRMLHDFLRGCHYEHTHEAASVIYPDRSREWAQADGAGYRYFPLVSTYCDRLAVAMATRIPELTLYDSRTGDDLPAGHPEVTQWADDLRDARADTVLPTLERWVTAMGQAVISPTWTGGRIRWHLSTPYQVRVWQSLTDPSEFSEAQAVAFELPQPVDSLGMTSPSIWSVWTREPQDDGTVRWGHYVTSSTGARLDNPLFGTGNENGYQTYPHVLVHTEDPAPGELWIPPREPWIRQQIGVNLAITDMWHGARYQIHPVSIITGAHGEFDESPVVGPGTSLSLPEGASLSFVSPNLNLDEYRQLIDHDLMTGGLGEALDPTTFTSQGAYQSIAGLQLRRHDLQLRRERVCPYYVRALTDLFEAHRAAANYWQGRGAKRVRYSPHTRLRVVFRPLPTVVDRQADAQATELEIQRGITSVVERIMDREGVSRAEAERRMRERLAERQTTDTEG